MTDSNQIELTRTSQGMLMVEGKIVCAIEHEILPDGTKVALLITRPPTARPVRVLDTDLARALHP